MSLGRTAARDGNQVRFLPAAQLALPARPRPVVDGGFESLIDEPSPRSGDSEGAYRNRLSRLAVRQPFISFQQRKGPLYRAGQRLAPAGYLNQIGPLGWCQFDFVLLWQAYPGTASLEDHTQAYSVSHTISTLHGTSTSTTTTRLRWWLHPAFTAGGAASLVGAARPFVA